VEEEEEEEDGNKQGMVLRMLASPARPKTGRERIRPSPTRGFFQWIPPGFRDATATASRSLAPPRGEERVRKGGFEF
jgi:hypothetical protein